MKRTTLLVAAVVVVGTLVVPAAGVLAQETESEGDEAVPGEQLSGVVGVQSAELDGEVERNAYRISLEQADDNATKASRIAEKIDESRTRLTELEERKADLKERRANGDISEGRYRAEMARLATETGTVAEQLNRSNATAAELPEGTLEENGVNVTAIRTLSETASELGGGEVAEIARDIAGDRGGLVERGPPEDRGGDAASDAGDTNRTDERRTDRVGAGDRTETTDGETPDGSTDSTDDHDDTADGDSTP